MQILCACHTRLGPKNGICGKVNLGDGGFQCLQRITDLPICFVLFISTTCTCSTDIYVAHNFRQSILLQALRIRNVKTILIFNSLNQGMMKSWWVPIIENTLTVSLTPCVCQLYNGHAASLSLPP